MATRVISTRLALDGEKEFKKQLSDVNSELRNLDADMKNVTESFKGNANTAEALRAKQKVLTGQIEQQEEKVRALRQALDDAEDAYGDNNKKTDEYYRSLKNAETQLTRFQRELKETNRYLDEAESSADNAASSIDGFGRETKGAKDDIKGFADEVDDISDAMKNVPSGSNLTGILGNLGKVKTLASGGAVAAAVVGGISEAVSFIDEITDSTEDYRKVMGALDVSSAAAGYTAEETEEAYTRLYGILGDYQTTATTVANLQAIGLEQEDLMKMIDLVTGAWAKYGDSIPIDGLAESINETIKTGQVTGVLADVLNWGSEEGENFGLTLKDNIEFEELSEEALSKLTDEQRKQYEKTKEQYEATNDFNEALGDAKTAEDFFNVALGESQTAADNANKVMQAMSDQGLLDTAESFRDNEDAAIKAREAQEKYEEAQARVAEALLPAKTALLEFKTNVWDALTKSIALAGDTFAGVLKFFSGENAEVRANMVVDETEYALNQAETYKATQDLATAGIVEQGWDSAALQQMAATVVNGVNAGNANSGPTTVKTVINLDGRQMAEAVSPALREYDKANPEVTSDR